jgi:NADP-dependent 3-hydroxy acid dehydrogenase YdfG
MFSLKNKNALITGATGGIGNAIAKTLASLSEIKIKECSVPAATYFA